MSSLILRRASGTTRDAGVVHRRGTVVGHSAMGAGTAIPMEDQNGKGSGADSIGRVLQAKYRSLPALLFVCLSNS